MKGLFASIVLAAALAAAFTQPDFSGILHPPSAVVEPAPLIAGPFVDRTHKTAQMEIFVATRDGRIAGPMSRRIAEEEARDLFPSADPRLIIEDGHGGYRDAKTHEPLQDILAAQDPNWSK